MIVVLKRPKVRQLACCVSFILIFVQPLWAWNNVGHRAVAELAWRRMDVSQREAASELLRHHPHYETLLTKNIPAGVSREEWAFLTAAVWPDMVRKAGAGQPQKPARDYQVRSLSTCDRLSDCVA